MDKKKLSQLSPRPIELEIIKDDETKTLIFRPVTLEDWTYFQEKYGNKFGSELNDLPYRDLVSIVYVLLEDKSDFLFEEKEIINDIGKPETVEITGPEKLAKCFSQIQGIAILTEIMMRCMGLDQLSPEELEAAVENAKEVKKKVNQAG